MKPRKFTITYFVLMLFFEIVTADRHTYIFGGLMMDLEEGHWNLVMKRPHSVDEYLSKHYGNEHLPRPFLIFEVFDQTMIAAENFQVHFEVPIERRLTYVQVVVTGRLRPTVTFSWSRTTVEFQYNWWQLSEVIRYHIRALGQYKPLPTTTTEEPSTTETTTTTTTTKKTTKRSG